VAKISDLRRYADLKGVDVRTVRLWCQAGKDGDGRKFPAKKRGKRWHLHRHLIQREENLQYFRRYFGNGNGKQPTSEHDKRALEYTLVKMCDEDPRLRDPEERRKFMFYRFKHHPDAYRATSYPYADIWIAAAWLKLKNGRIPTSEELAKHLKMSVSKLYRRYPGIMSAIKARCREDLSTPGGL
jgi:hypothetical protein